MTADHAPQHGPMSAVDLRAARALYDAMREGLYWRAGALNASYVDADAVVREWRELCRSGPHWKDVPVELRVLLNALADGWPT